jgi:competence protein ComEC
VSAASAWLLATALWVACLHPGPWWLSVCGTLGLVAGAVAGAGRGVRVGLGLHGAAETAAGCVRCAHVGGGAHVQSAGGRRLWLLAWAVAAVAAGGAGLSGGQQAMLDVGPLSRLAAGGGEAELAAMVVTEPRGSPTGAWFLVSVTSVDRIPTRARGFVRVDDLSDAPALGSRLAFTATARPLGRDDFDGYLRRLHAGVELSPTSRLSVRAAPGLLLRATNVARDRTRTAAHARLDRDRAVLLTGLVTGDTSGQAAERADQFDAAGLSHLVAVSGTNVALVLAGVLGVGSLMGVGMRGRVSMGLAALGWFAVLVRWEPSVLRASAVAALVLVAMLLGRGWDPRHLLAVAVVLLLLIDPLLAGQLGFGLSILATAGVLVVAPAVGTRLRGPPALRGLVAASVGAQLAVAPLLLATEGAVPLTSVPANLIAVPAAGVASVGGVAVALLAQVSVPAAGLVALAAAPALSVVLAAGRVFAPGPQLRPEHLLSPAVLLLAGALLLWRRSRRGGVATVAAAVVVALWPMVGPARPVLGLRLTMFDVGQGDALLVEAPSVASGVAGAEAVRLLVDGGPEPERALRLLRSRGVRRLDAVVLTHPHHDHSGGLPAVLEHLPVGALLVGPSPVRLSEPPAPSVVETYAVAQRRGVPVLTLGDGHAFALGAARVEVLSPPRGRPAEDDPNENSLVLRIVDGAGTMLLAGDAEEDAQSRLLRRPERLRADLLKVPHHGGDTNAGGFLAAVHPRIAVVSVGADNDYGHPNRRVLADLAGTRLLRTDVDGTVTVAPQPRPTGAGAAAGSHPRLYTPADVPTPPPALPVRRTGGTATVPRRRPAARRAAGRRRGRGGRPAGGRAEGHGATRPPHGLAIRRSPSRGPP